jgi:hypothetical protein
MWQQYGKCLAGTIGGGILGTFAGASVASAIPLSIVALGFIGFVGGALAGAAGACA